MKGSADLTYAFSLYALISLALMSVQYLTAASIVFLAYRLPLASCFPGMTGFFRTACYDSAGFAFLTFTNTLLQFCLASLLARDLGRRPACYGIVTFSGFFSTMFFLRLSAGSSLGLYALAGGPLIFSYLVGGYAALLQKETENPFNDSELRVFLPR